MTSTIKKNTMYAVCVVYLVQLEDYAACAPHVAGLAPAQLQDHLRGPVVPG